MRCWVKSRNERNPRRVLVRKDLSRETAGDKPEEGGDDVKSAWPLHPGRETRYNGRDNGLPSGNVELIPQTRSKFGLQSVTRLHEVGIASNRGSATPR